MRGRRRSVCGCRLKVGRRNSLDPKVAGALPRLGEVVARLHLEQHLRAAPEGHVDADRQIRGHGSPRGADLRQASPLNAQMRRGFGNGETARLNAVVEDDFAGMRRVGEGHSSPPQLMIANQVNV